MAKFQNRDRPLAKLAAIPPEIRSAIRQALAQASDEIVEAQRRAAPVDSGKLRASIVATFGGKGPAYSSLGVGGGGDPDLTVRITAGNSAVRYASLVEFGTAPHINGGKFAGSEHPGATAVPFFYPPYRAYRRRAKSMISRATTRAVKKAAR